MPDPFSSILTAQDRFIYSDSIADMPPAWEEAVAEADLFLGRDYLLGIEAAPPLGMVFGYLLFQRNGRPVGAAVLQFATFDADRQIRRRTGQTSGPADCLKDRLAQHLRFRVLVAGNLLLTGEHGFFFRPEAVDPEEAISLLEEALSRLELRLAAEGRPVQAILVKDLGESRHREANQLAARGFHRLSFEPNMVLELRPEWTGFSGYLQSLSSKYRVRARRNAKLAAALRRRELTTEEVERFNPRLHELYYARAERAEFNMVDLHPEYFLRLKSCFPECFRLFGYFLQEDLVGFFTTFRNGRELEAHFLGFAEDINRECRLYLNMLYDIIKEGIDAGAERIIFARTALEIKSSVGAEARPLNLFLRARTPLLNLLAPALVRYLEPRTDWVPRQPFKETEEQMNR